MPTSTALTHSNTAVSRLDGTYRSPILGHELTSRICAWVLTAEADKDVLERAQQKIRDSTELTDCEKQDLECLIARSPSPSFTASVLLQFDSLGNRYKQLSKGFRFFRDIGRGLSSGPTSYRRNGSSLETPGSLINSLEKEPIREAKSERGRAFPKEVARRASGRCEVTGASKESRCCLECAHLIGLGTKSHPAAFYFWDVLRLFWPPEILVGLQAAILVEINHPSNGLSMEISTHRKFDNLDFFLEVVEGTYEEAENGGASYEAKIRFRNKVELTDHWTPPAKHANGRMSIFRFEDGDTIKLSTADRAANPLPDPMLLRLRAYVTQCAFPKAAGECEEEEVWDDEDDGAGSHPRILEWLDTVEQGQCDGENVCGGDLNGSWERE
jgi:hypothetical protein